MGLSFKDLSKTNILSVDKIDDISDGHYTFKEYKHQKVLLFSVIINTNAKYSWKSFKHYDGRSCLDSNGKYFAVGIDSRNFHYVMYLRSDKYYHMFNCKELECGNDMYVGCDQLEIDNLTNICDEIIFHENLDDHDYETL